MIFIQLCLSLDCCFCFVRLCFWWFVDWNVDWWL